MNRVLKTFNKFQTKFKRCQHTNTSSAKLQSSLDDRPASLESLATSTLKSKQSTKKLLTEQLIAQGLLTKEMIKKLKREWKDDDAELKNDDE